MKARFPTAFATAVLFAAAGAPVPLAGQTALKPPPPPVNPPPADWVDPRNPVKEDPNWRPPLTPDGHPNLAGRWAQISDILPYSLEEPEGDRDEHTRIGGQRPVVGRPIVDPVDGKLPYQAWARPLAAELLVEHRKPTKPEYLDPIGRGFLDGVPRVNYQAPFEIIQQKDQIVISYDYFHTYRIIPTDGRAPLPKDVKLWMGSSRGRWEGSTLVVDVDNQNDQTWLQIVGGFHSDVYHVEERWTLVSSTHIEYLGTLTDPKVFTQPVKMRLDFRRQEDDEQWEHAVWEGNKLGGLSIEFWGGAKADPPK